MGDSACWLLHSDFCDKRTEEVAVFGKRDVLWRRADDLRASLFKLFRKIERRLPAVLDYHAVALLAVVDLHHVLERERLEVELVGSVVVGRDGLWIGVYHHDFVATLPKRERRVAAAPVELDALPDAVWPPAQDHDLVASGRL